MTSRDAQQGPPPPDSVTGDLWQATSLRLRILETSAWRRDLSEYMSRHVSSTSLIAWGEPTIAANLLKSVVTKVATLYRLPPVLTHDALTPDGQAYMASIGLFAQHRRLNRLVVGLRDCLVRVHWSPELGLPQIELVPPHRAYVRALRHAPDHPVEIRQAILMRDPLLDKGKPHRWFWEVWSIEDPFSPTYRIIEADGRRLDRSADFGVDTSYPWVADGVPYIPLVLYHAEDTGCVMDSDGWSELVDGTLTVAMLVTFWLHVVRNASWSQAYGINVKLRGARLNEGGADPNVNARTVAADPKSILMFDSALGGSVGTIDKPSDPQYVIAAITQYAGWILSQIGLGTDDVQIAEAQSGVALTIRQEGITRLQQDHLPGMTKGDLALAALAARVANTFGGGSLPTDGWEITYPAAPKTRADRIDDLDHKQKMIDLGLLSRIDLILEIRPWLTRPEAIQEAYRIDIENAIGAAVPARGEPNAGE